MFRSYYYAEIFILLLLNYSGQNIPSKNGFKCSRLKSRLVRLIIHKKILPVLQRYKLSLPMECPFHGHHDVYWWPDLQLDFLDGQWVCPFCSQIFSSEELVIKHWDMEHLDNQREDSVCLANFCDVFRCDIILATLEAEKNKYRWEKFSDFHHVQNRSHCDETKMILLQKKCKIVIGQCLLSFLPSLTAKDFQDIEEDLNEALCSYLTCNKYTDGSLQVVQHVPLLLCLIIGFLLVAAFTVCYYIVYTLSYPFHPLHKELFCNGSVKPIPFFDGDDFVYKRDKNGRYYKHR